MRYLSRSLALAVFGITATAAFGHGGAVVPVPPRLPPTRVPRSPTGGLAPPKAPPRVGLPPTRTPSGPPKASGGPRRGSNPGTPPPGAGAPPPTPRTPSGGGRDPVKNPDPPTPPPPPPETGKGPKPPTTAPTGPVPPVPRGRKGTLSSDHWTHWWYTNRRFLVDLSARVWDSGAQTPSSSRGDADALWRAQVQRVLVEALKSENEDIASSAAIALGKSGDPSHLPSLVRVLQDQKRQQPVREAAALGLGLLPASTDATDATEAATCRSALENIVRSSKERHRLRGIAVYALGLRGEIASLPFLLDASRAPQATWDIQAASLTALGLSGHDLVRGDLEGVLGAAKGRSRAHDVERVYAAHGLASMGSPKSIVALRKAAGDRSENVRRAAVLALGALTNEADDATAELLVRLIHRDKDRGVRNMAVLALARSGHANAAPALRYAYKKGDRLHQPFAALALGLLARRTGDVELVDPLVSDLKTRANADLRGALAIAVGLGRGTDAPKVLRSIVKDRGDPVTRAHAALALGLLGDRQGGPGVLRPLLADGNDSAMKREAALALGMLGDRQAVKLLIDAVENGNSIYVRGSAAVALGRIGGRDAGAALIRLSEDTKRPAIGRAMAVVGLGLLLDRTNGKSLARVGADLNWYLHTSTVYEILTIL